MDEPNAVPSNLTTNTVPTSSMDAVPDATTPVPAPSPPAVPSVSGDTASGTPLPSHEAAASGGEIAVSNTSPSSGAHGSSIAMAAGPTLSNSKEAEATPMAETESHSTEPLRSDSLGANGTVSAPKARLTRGKKGQAADQSSAEIAVKVQLAKPTKTNSAK